MMTMIKLFVKMFVAGCVIGGVFSMGPVSTPQAVERAPVQVVQSSVDDVLKYDRDTAASERFKFWRMINDLETGQYDHYQ